jgi:hypothetical protein
MKSRAKRQRERERERDEARSKHLDQVDQQNRQQDKRDEEEVERSPAAAVPGSCLLVGKSARASQSLGVARLYMYVRRQRT